MDLSKIEIDIFKKILEIKDIRAMEEMQKKIKEATKRIQNGESISLEELFEEQKEPPDNQKIQK